MMWFAGGWAHWWGWLLGALAVVTFWGVPIWAVWYLATAVTRRSAGSRAQGDPLEGDRPQTADPNRILDERPARGDIDAEEYRRLRDLVEERARPRQRRSARSAPLTALTGPERDTGPTRHAYRDVVQASTQVTITEDTVEVRFGKRAHNPHLLAAGFPDTDVAVSWWQGRELELAFG